MLKATAFPDTSTDRAAGFPTQSTSLVRQSPQRPKYHPTFKEARNQFPRPAARKRTTAVPISRPQSRRSTIPIVLPSMRKATAFPDTTPLGPMVSKSNHPHRLAKPPRPFTIPHQKKPGTNSRAPPSVDEQQPFQSAARKATGSRFPTHFPQCSKRKRSRIPPPASPTVSRLKSSNRSVTY